MAGQSVVLWGKCRSCRKKIDIIYPLTELATGILFVMIYIFKDKLATNLVWTGALGGLQIWYFLFLGTVLLTLFLIDLKHQLLPDGLIYSALLVSILLMILTNFSSLYLYLLTGFGGALFFLMLNLITFGKGMGLGDTKLALLIGTVCGPIAAVIAFWSAFIIGGIIATLLLVAGRAKFGQKIAFGPFMILGFGLVLLLL